MPLWVWILIWATLVLGLLGMLVLFAVRLFRKAKAIVTELKHLASLATILDQAGGILGDQRADLAVLANRAELRQRRAQVRFDSSLRKQARTRVSIQRAKDLLAVNASHRDWFPAREHPTQQNPL